MSVVCSKGTASTQSARRGAAILLLCCWWFILLYLYPCCMYLFVLAVGIELETHLLPSNCNGAAVGFLQHNIAFVSWAEEVWQELKWH